MVVCLLLRFFLLGFPHIIPTTSFTGSIIMLHQRRFQVCGRSYTYATHCTVYVLLVIGISGGAYIGSSLYSDYNCRSHISFPLFGSVGNSRMVRNVNFFFEADIDNLLPAVFDFLCHKTYKRKFQCATFVYFNFVFAVNITKSMRRWHSFNFYRRTHQQLTFVVGDRSGYLMFLCPYLHR